MAAKRQSQPREKSSEQPQYAWSPRVRAIVSIVIVLHLTAVFAAPWSIPPPSSELSRTVAGWFEPYLHAAFIYHGYRYFAPNPGPSHVVRYELLLADGSTETGQFPDLRQHWPRLLYHRHFMVAERVNEAFQMTAQQPQSPQFPPGRYPPGAQSRAQAEYDEMQNIYQINQERRQLLLTGIAERLLDEHDAQAVRLFAVEHRIPAPEELRDGMRLDDPRNYLVQPLGEYTRDEP